MAQRSRKVTLSGLLGNTPAEARAFKSHILTDMAAQARAIEAAVKGAAPVDTGELRASVKVRAKPYGGAKMRGVIVNVEATASRPPTKGDAPKRRGDVPYGVFVDNDTGFMSSTIERAQPALLKALNDSVRRWIVQQNSKVISKGA